MSNLFNPHPLSKLFNQSLTNLPSPSNISLFWNFGSLLAFCLLTQVSTGIFLSFHYSPDTFLAFNSVCHISRNVNYGWLIRLIHINGATAFFLCLYIHIGRSLYYSSYLTIQPWLSGTLIFLTTMITAFLGYVLPWGQMSFWGATVITNLISVLPYIGTTLTSWLWGGFSVSNATLTRFYSLHFLLPMIILVLVMIHLLLLHEHGSSNPLGTNSNIDKIPFHPYFSFKDLVGLLILSALLSLVVMLNPYMITDPENFLPANPLSTPAHIQPEWYFLFAYAILRSIPNKLGGVVALVMSILIILILPASHVSQTINQKSLIKNLAFWLFIAVFILLSWLGSQPVETPFIILSQSLTTMYFLYFMLNPLQTTSLSLKSQNK